ncbi:hypothetical protein D3C78_1044410 [compost metagenome]
MPGQRRVDIIEQAGAHHEGLAGTTFFARATVITHCAGKMIGFQMPGESNSGHQ